MSSTAILVPQAIAPFIAEKSLGRYGFERSQKIARSSFHVPRFAPLNIVSRDIYYPFFQSTDFYYIPVRFILFNYVAIPSLSITLRKSSAIALRLHVEYHRELISCGE